jgi:hypothetical protein
MVAPHLFRSGDFAEITRLTAQVTALAGAGAEAPDSPEFGP